MIKNMIAQWIRLPISLSWRCTPDVAQRDERMFVPFLADCWYRSLLDISRSSMTAPPRKWVESFCCGARKHHKVLEGLSAAFAGYRQGSSDPYRSKTLVVGDEWLANQSAMF
jgi:hypothetical protein